MRKLLIVAAALVLSACGPTITNGHVDRAIKACAGRGGIDRISMVTFIFGDVHTSHSVYCVDGKEFYIGTFKPGQERL